HALFATVRAGDNSGGIASACSFGGVRFIFDDQIASQPAAVQAVLDRPAPPRLDPSKPVIFAGLGTSLHAARVAAAWAGFPAQALDAHELALRLPIPR